jgi:signal transduction histidine kinase
MLDDWTVPGSVRFGGLVVAAVGFVLTRAFVVASVDGSVRLLPFLVGSVPFLAVGFGLSAFGVALSVSSHPRVYVAAVARWTVLGTAAMALVVGTTLAGASMAARMLAPPAAADLAARALLSGAVGGALTGVHSARTRRSRRERTRANDRLTVLNRILRHEVLNKVNVVRGYADLVDGDATGDAARRSADAIRRSADAIDATVEDVGTLTDPEDPVPTSVRSLAEAAVDGVTTGARDGGTGVRLGDLPDVRVLATPGFAAALRHLVANAVEHGSASDGSAAAAVTPAGRGAVDGPAGGRPVSDGGAAGDGVSVWATATATAATVHVSDDGPGLPPDQQAVLTGADLPTYDDPGAGFGLLVVRFLVEASGGSVAVDASEDGTTVSVTLRRADAPGGGVSPRDLGRAAVAALVAGVGMGVTLVAAFGDLAVIGALYGVAAPAVGWVSHLFHSLVFGTVFAAALSHPRLAPRLRRPLSVAAAGAGYGALLWVTAAGVVMPLWLRAVGLPATLPSLSLPSLAGHLLWGVLLGGTYALVRG